MESITGPLNVMEFTWNADIGQKGFHVNSMTFGGKVIALTFFQTELTLIPIGKCIVVILSIFVFPKTTNPEICLFGCPPTPVPPLVGFGVAYVVILIPFIIWLCGLKYPYLAWVQTTVWKLQA